ncbi:MAG: hypothetical protein ACYCOU_15015 [Sulfobacillus sp.]
MPYRIIEVKHTFHPEKGHDWSLDVEALDKSEFEGWQLQEMQVLGDKTVYILHRSPSVYVHQPSDVANSEGAHNQS